MRSAIVIGRVCDNPTLKTIQGKDLALFNIYRDFPDKEGKPSILINKIISHGKLSQTVMQYLRKDYLCCIEGIIDDNKDIHASKIVFLNSKCDN